MENNNLDYTYIQNELNLRAHQPSGPFHKMLHKRKALDYLEKNNLMAVCHLVESHSPTYRIKTAYRYDRLLQTENGQNKKTMDKKLISFNCPEPIEDQIKNLTDKIKVMPKEWTIIQLTSQHNLQEHYLRDISNTTTDPLHVTVFNCGQSDIDPFCILVDAPTDVSGAVIELGKEIQALRIENKSLHVNYFGEVPLDKVHHKQKKLYSEHRININYRLKNIVKQIQSQWLREWKCLFIGKFVDNQVDKIIQEKLNAVLQEDETFKPSKVIMYILSRVLACSLFLSPSEITRAVHYCIPDHKELRFKMILMLKKESNCFFFKHVERYPIILILDEKLDCFSWEQIDILQDHPVSRMPSLHFTYALFKEHNKSIVNGYMHITSKNGHYIINPGLDLKKMELRLSKFFEYWLPDWKGLVGQTPSSDQFSEYLQGGDIFVYNGHGSGIQFMSGSKIQQLRVDAVVLLFGCSSVRMQSSGSLVEMHDIHHNYMIACSPCVVGMLWDVTDFDTDILTTALLSRWLPSNASTPWIHVDKSKWDSKGLIKAQSPTCNRKEKTQQVYEPDLLRAISQARMAPAQYITKAAIIARGLPIKVCDDSP